MDLTTTNRERLQAETIEKQKKRHEHAQMVRERAKQLKKRKDLDEGLGGEMETYKATSDGKPFYNFDYTFQHISVSNKAFVSHLRLR